MKTHIHTYGGEIEKPVFDSKTGLPHTTSQDFFLFLEKQAKKRKTFSSFHTSDLKPDVILGIQSQDLGEQGMDNGFNLLETALPYQQNLSELYQKMQEDLRLTIQGLGHEGAGVVNLSNHPLAMTDETSYKKYVMPKGLYTYFPKRKIKHRVGINAKAQNSPATGVLPHQAADAISVIIGAGAAFVGLFANSPYEFGKRSKYIESRLMMWHDMFGNTTVKGDDRVWKFPPHRFHTMAQYFNWIFGGDSGIYFVIPQSKDNDYKTIVDKALVIPSHPSVLRFLSKKSWEGIQLKKFTAGDMRNPITLTPRITDMEVMQFALFFGARIRFGLKKEAFTPEEFVNACKNEKEYGVEKLFENGAEFTYIEGRDPGANFPDNELLEIGEDVASTTLISPSALQAGLIQNLSYATAFIDSFTWGDLHGLRDSAIKNGLQGTYHEHSVYDFTKKIVEIASNGLERKDRSHLAYPEYVLKTKQNGADRAIEFVEKQKGSMRDNIKKLVKSRQVVMPT